MGRKNNTHALHARNHPLSIKWRVDMDYVDKLSPEQKQWMAGFIDAHYSGDFRGAPESDWPTVERRKSYTNKNVANADCYHGLENEHLLTGFDAPVSARFNNLTRLDKSNAQKVSDCIPALPTDLSPTPEYLNSPEYKKALAEYRANLNQTRRVCKPKETSAYFVALNNLNKVIPSHD